MYLREIQVVADPESALGIVQSTVGKFDRQVLCITNAFSSVIQTKLQTPESPKLFVRLTSNLEKVRKSQEHFLPMNIWHEFDFAKYRTLDNTERKRALLDTIRAIVIRAASHFNWDVAIIDEAIARIRDADYRLTVRSRKKWRHPNKRLSMQLECRFDFDAYELTAVLFKNRHGEIARYHLSFAIPISDYYTMYLSDARWVSPEVFELHAATGYPDYVWRCTIDSQWLQ